MKKLTSWNNSEKTDIGIKHGNRCLNIASLNIDDLRTTKRYIELIQRLETQKNRYSMHTRNTQHDGKLL